MFIFGDFKHVTYHKLLLIFLSSIHIKLHRTAIIHVASVWIHVGREYHTIFTDRWVLTFYISLIKYGRNVHISLTTFDKIMEVDLTMNVHFSVHLVVPAIDRRYTPGLPFTNMV